MLTPSSPPRPTARLKSGGRLRRAIVTALGALTLLAAVSIVLDRRLATRAEALPDDSVQWGRLLSSFGTSLYMAVCGLLVLAGALAARHWARTPALRAAAGLWSERAGYALATLATSTVAAQAIKHVIGRARPPAFRSVGAYYFEGLSLSDSFASFPSGHSTTAFAMATALSLLLPPLRVALFTLAAGIALSRVVVQAHYVSDTLAGSLLGVTSGLVVAHLFARRGWAFEAGPAGLALRQGLEETGTLTEP